MVTMAYFKASEDLICGAKQKEHTLRSKIELVYNTIKKQQEEKEAQGLFAIFSFEGNGHCSYAIPC